MFPEPWFKSPNFFSILELRARRTPRRAIPGMQNNDSKVCDREGGVNLNRSKNQSVMINARCGML
jgi:hypothetical protein